MNIDWLGAIVIGAFGAGHCLGMCGGISSLIAMNNRTQHQLPITIAYNLGRLSSYMVVGALVGGTFATIISLSGATQILNGLRVVAALFLIALALYIGRWWNGLLKVEALGKHLWKFLSPLTHRLLPIYSFQRGYIVGLVWGWLPCGLVYSMLSWSAVSGSALNGALIMLCFGIGTLPSMILIGQSAHRLKNWQNNLIFRQLAAISILLYGIYSLQHAVP